MERGHMFLIADAHSDFLYKMVNDGADIANPSDSQQLYLDGMDKGGVRLQAFAAWMDRRKPQQYQLQALELIDAFERMLECNPRLERFGRDSSISENGKIYALMTLEGGEPVSDVFMVRTLRRLGVSAISLTWNHKNRLGYPSTGRTNKGLTPLGREVVQEMGRVGMAVDVSHLNDAGIDDVLGLSANGRPPMASHSNARAMFNHPRNLSDAHIKAIADAGGFIGVNFYRPFLARGEASVKNIVEHIEYIGKKGSWKCIGLGSDFDGMDSPAQGIESCARFGALTAALIARGHPPERVADIAGGNFFRYMKLFFE